MNQEIKDYLKPNNDVVFKRLFGKTGNEKLVKDFLEAVLNTTIRSVELGKETQLLPEKIDDKLGILDVKVSLNDGTLVDVEMQNLNHGFIEKRMTYYLSQLYTSELTKGKKYSELNKAIVIAILNFDYFEELKEYHTIWKMTETSNKNKFLEEQEIHFIELPKFLRSNVNTDRKLDQWLLFIDYSRRELIKMAEDKNNMIKEAQEQYNYLTGDEDMQRIAFLRRKYELDYNSGLDYAKQQGMKDGYVEGKKKGMERGRKEGMEEGSKKEKIEIAKKMLDKKMDIAIISEITGLTIEEINNIK